MTRQENLKRVRMSKSERAKVLGVEPLQPGEASKRISIRGPAEAIRRLDALTPKQRGDLLLKALEMGD